VEVIKIEIGISPKGSVNDDNVFPFAIDGKTPFLYHVSFWQRKDEQEVEEFVSKWVKTLNVFPVFAFFECFDFQQQEIENECLSYSIKYMKSKWGESDFYNKIKIQNIEQFNVIFPYLYANGSMNNFACLSLGKDVFSIGNRYLKTVWGENKKTETPIVTAMENSTVLWVDYDGDGMVFISSDINYSQLALVIKTLPKETVYSIVEYDE